MATKAQIAIIHVLRTELKIADQEYRDILKQYLPKSVQASSTNLTTAGAAQLISQLKGGPVFVQKASQMQRRKIIALWHGVSRAPEESRLEALDEFLLTRFSQRGGLRNLPKNTASRVILGLEKMLREVSNTREAAMTAKEN
jgi:hypothetical protein